MLESTNGFFITEDNSKAIIIGVIDYFQKYTISKILEKYSKKLINFNFNLDTSSQNPEYYSHRFLKFIKQIIQ